MKYRQLRKIDTGQWLGVLFTVAGDAFSVPPESHLTDIAAALGLLPASLEVVDADSDVRVGPLLVIPSPPPFLPTVAELAHTQAVSDAADEMVDAFGPGASLAEKATRKAALRRFVDVVQE